MANLDYAPVFFLVVPGVLKSFYSLDRSSRNICMYVGSTFPDGLLLGFKRAQKRFSALWLGHAQAERFQYVAHVSDIISPLSSSCVSGTTVDAKGSRGRWQRYSRVTWLEYLKKCSKQSNTTSIICWVFLGEEGNHTKHCRGSG